MSAAYAELRLEGPYAQADVVQRIAQAIADCRAHGRTHLLTCIDKVTGLPSPSLAARHQMIREWAQAAGGVVTMALVARAELIDPERFGVVTAANFGMRANVFDNEADAVEWLMAQR